MGNESHSIERDKMLIKARIISLITIVSNYYLRLSRIITRHLCRFFTALDFKNNLGIHKPPHASGGILLRHAAKPCEGTEKVLGESVSCRGGPQRPPGIHQRIRSRCGLPGGRGGPLLQLSGQQEVFHIVLGDDFE